MQLTRLARRAQRRYRAGFFASFSRARHLCLVERFEPDEAYRLGLLDPSLKKKEISCSVSRKKLTKLQRSLNPLSWEPMLKNKGMFNRYCVAHGIAVPKLFALFFHDVPGWFSDGSSPFSRENWVAVLQAGLPDRFIAKPAMGSLGRGVRAFGRQGEEFVDHEGTVCSAADLYESMRGDAEFDSFVIEEMLTNHSDIDVLTGSPVLQTLRMVTVCGADNRCRVVVTHLKMIAGLGVTDNFASGQAGNMSSLVDLESGVLKPARAARPDAVGMCSFAVHPQTGRVFSEFALPFWEEACSLVETVAGHFLPIRTVGWDVALTPTGPMVIEGNFWWNPFNQHPCMGQVGELLRESAETIQATL